MWVKSDDNNLPDWAAPPKPVVCQFCGKLLYFQGLIVRIGRVTWLHEPELCNCDGAVKMRELEQIRQKKNEQAMKDAQVHQNIKKDIKRLLKESGMSPRAQGCVFEKFIITDNNQHAYNAATAYIKNFNNPDKSKTGLYLAGDIGTGKSFTVFCIANALINQGIPVIAMTGDDILNKIKQSFDNTNSLEYEILNIYKKVPLLIIDDLGKEELSKWGLAKLNNILYYRHEHFKPVIITTNYNDETLIKRLTPENSDDKTAEAIIDRLYQTCNAIILTGQSWRKHKND